MEYVVIVLVFLLVIVSRLTYRSGFENGVASVTHKHQHIWGPWERLEVTMIDSCTGQAKYTLTHQKRACDDCKFEEWREI